jgi:predicted dehydrogenase
MIVYDDLEPSEKIKIYDKGITMAEDANEVYRMLVGYRTGDMLAPQIEGSEALLTEANHFVDCIVNKRQPITDGELGLRIVELAAAATASMKQQGVPVTL